MTAGAPGEVSPSQGEEKHTALPLSPACRQPSTVALGSRSRNALGPLIAASWTQEPPAPPIHHSSLSPIYPGISSSPVTEVSLDTCSSASTSSPRLVLTLGYCARRACDTSPMLGWQGPPQTPLFWAPRPLHLPAGRHWRPRWRQDEPPQRCGPQQYPQTEQGLHKQTAS